MIVNACGMLVVMTIAAPPAAPLAALVQCCTPITGAVLDAESAQQLAGVLRALAEPTRLRLVSLIAGSPNQEACVCALIEPVGLSQPTVSHHLKILVDAGILGRQQRGKWAHYALVPGALVSVAGLLTPPT